MNYDPKKYQQALRDWLSAWVKSQEELRPRGWKQKFEQKAGLTKGYFYKLQSGPLEFDIINLAKIANQIGMTPAEILRIVEISFIPKKS